MARPAAQPKLRFNTYAFSTIKAEPVEWLWRPWLQRGALNLLTGQPGVGKSTLTCELVAALTTGRALPGDEPKPPVNCYVLNSEDAAGNTIKPRLLAQGADISRVWGVSDSVSLDSEAVKEMAHFIRAHDIGFVSIDPLQGWMGGAVDMHRANETREWANYLRAVAVETNCAIMFIRHMRKGSLADNNINSGMGSIDITGFARSEIGARQDKSGQCYITRVKGNMGRRPVPLGYEIAQQDAESDVGLFKWEGPYMESDGPKARGEPPKLKACIEWLRDQLSCSARPIHEIHKSGKEAGFKPYIVTRSAKYLNLDKRGEFWHLPSNDGERSNAVAEPVPTGE